MNKKKLKQIWSWLNMPEMAIVVGMLAIVFIMLLIKNLN